MHNLSRSDLPAKRQSACKFLLLMLWCGGMILGILFAHHADGTYASLMRSAATEPVSIVGLLVIFSPFLFSAFAVFISRPGLLFPLAFAKAFAFGFSAFSVDMAFQSAGWLLRVLLMFSDICLLPLLLWFWLRSFDGDKQAAAKILAVCAAVSVFIGAFDYCMVSPFLMALL